MFAVCIVGTHVTGSSALMAIAISAICDCLDDVVVVWRFTGNHDDPMNDRHDAQATVICCILLAALSMLSAAEAITKLVFQHHASVDTVVQLAMSVVLLFSSALAVAKFVVAYVIGSEVMLVDACSTAAVAVLAGVCDLSAVDPKVCF